MGFGNSKKKNSAKSNSKPKSLFVTLASIWASDKSDSGFYGVTNKNRKDYKAPGRLLFEDAKSGDVYEIHTISIFEPKIDVDGLAYNLAVNLLNPKSATKVGNTGDEEGSSDEGDTEYEPAEEA